MKNNEIFKMNRNRILWFIVLAIVIVAITTSLKTSYSQQNEKPSEIKCSPTPQKPTREQIRAKYESQFPVANYDAAELSNSEEREQRKAKNNRYDKIRLVVKNPNPQTIESNLADESVPPSAIPIKESDLVIIGDILDAKAYLSNNQTGVYSEFNIRVDETLKNNSPISVIGGEKITADRLGGFVQYPNGQKLLYSVSGKGMPRVGKRYILFLAKPDLSPNYSILTGYELKENKIHSLDDTYIFRAYNEANATDFIKTIKEAISQQSQKVGNQ
ncbi:MAG: hypothetical protein M3384_02490 [Acidobacteriota bacterium]|nr:hypothetical protein [Acidobacteriota bacterium]